MVGMANPIRSCPCIPSERGDVTGFCYGFVFIDGHYLGFTTSNGPTSSRSSAQLLGLEFSLAPAVQVRVR